MTESAAGERIREREWAGNEPCLPFEHYGCLQRNFEIEFVNIPSNEGRETCQCANTPTGRNRERSKGAAKWNKTKKKYVLYCI